MQVHDELGENNDDESMVSDVTEEPLQLDTSGDTDNMVMLHVYNFRTAGAGGGMSMPPTDASATHDHAGSSAAGTTSLIAVGLALLATLAVAGAFATQRVRSRN